MKRRACDLLVRIMTRDAFYVRLLNLGGLRAWIEIAFAVVSAVIPFVYVILSYHLIVSADSSLLYF